ncbi:hypothetical protein DFJ74DRAFT_398649 [Hyaloraphidium curvatum]|nr:hypothetical protein DFJ74DRAFT_398649 [Hyaloraphidium curvatum]
MRFTLRWPAQHLHTNASLASVQCGNGRTATGRPAWPRTRATAARWDAWFSFSGTGTPRSLARVVELEGFGRGLVASRDLVPGELVFEEPALLSLLRTRRSERCHNCFGLVHGPGLVFTFEEDPMLRNDFSRKGDSDGESASELFCSVPCRDAALSRYNKFLSSPRRSWPALFSACQTSGRVYPLLVSRLMALVLLNLSRTRTYSDPTADLVYDKEHSKDDSVADYGVVTRTILTEQGQSSLFNLTFFLRKASMLNLNAISITMPGPDGLWERVGTGIFMETSMINHACNPNLDVQFSAGMDGQPVMLHATANRDIREGDQLFISYVDADTGIFADVDQRQAFLRAAYGFQCRCERCTTGKRN